MLSAGKSVCGSHYLLAASERHLVKPSELDIYYEPEEVVKEINSGNNHPTLFHENVSSARKKLTKAFSGLLTTHEKVSSLFTYAELQITGIYNEALQDPYSLLVPGSITMATVGGVLVAGKGKKPLSRIFYGALFGATATAVTHPHRSLEIATTGYYHTSGLLSHLKNYFATKEETITEKVENEIKINNTELESNEVISEVVVKVADTETPASDNTSEINEDIVVETIENTEADKVIEEFFVVESESVSSVTSDIAGTTEEVLIDTSVVENESNPSENVTSIDDVTTAENTSVETSIPVQEELLMIKVDEIVNKDESHHVESESKFISETLEDKSTVKTLEGDYGQSNPQDEDMYSTRS